MQHSQEYYFSDNLFNTDWLGEVVEINDPEYVGRIKVKVFGKFDNLETEHIPWAYPLNYNSGGSSTGAGTFSLPKLGSIVNIRFDNGNIYFPQYTFIQSISNELKSEIGNDTDYLTAHSLIYDTEIEGGLKIFYSSTNGLMFKLSDRMIRMASDRTITVTNKAGDDYTAGDGNSIVIDPDGNLKIDMDKDLIVNIGENSKVTIEGNTELTINGNLTAAVKGTSDITVTGKLTVTAEDNAEITVSGDLKAEVKGDSEIKVGGDLKIEVDGDTDLKAANINAECKEAKIEASSCLIDAGTVELGGSNGEAVIMGETFLSYFDKHIHSNGNYGSPTGPPMLSLKSIPNNLSSIVSLKYT